MEPRTGCPVCNGFSSLDVSCPNCGEWMEDQGRLFDFLAPYSPYRPIDDLKRTEGMTDWEIYQCSHRLHCPHCGCHEVSWVAEQPM
ncbi:uncharacterized protein (DUF983 family) [Kroppenstedtia sanguinis]|uniref:Uncharacterized protein n=1 Tax=Kroppenstedtia sanguinis TaxID=1380684 RepID=A0ABW4C8D4_9BACL